MAGIIKKQLLKHLALFCENLDANRLNVSMAKGELELPNLKLNCDALHSLLNIPTWLSIDSALVDYVRVKIPILQITKTPIKIEFSNVDVEVSICDTPRAPNKPSPLIAAGGDSESKESSGASYGMIHKVLEGIKLSIESISARLTSTAFRASINLGPIEVFSTDFMWNVPADLKFSRIYDPKRQQVLTFKAINCQMLRLEATASKGSQKRGQWSLTPLKVMMSQFELRTILRRRTKDCQILCTKVQVLFDDLLWILTDSQIKAALLCAKTINKAMKKSVEQGQRLGLFTNTASDTDEANVSIAALAAAAGQTGDQMTSNIKNYNDRPELEKFRRMCPTETSMHAQFRRIEFHLYEDKIMSGADQDQFDTKRESVAPNGATQIMFETINIDHYPAHKAATSRRNFVRYSSSMQARDTWVSQVLNKFREEFQLLKQQAQSKSMLQKQSQTASKLYESVLLVHISDIQMYPVACDHRKLAQTGGILNAMTKMVGAQSTINGQNTPFFHLDLTNYFYPDGRDYPLCHNNIYIDCNAPEILVDWLSLEWLSQIALETAKAVAQMLQELGISKSSKTASTVDVDPSKHVDIRIEVKSAKIVVVNEKSYDSNSKKQTFNKNLFPITCDLFYPKGIELNIARMVLTNNRENPKGTVTGTNIMASTRQDLSSLISKYPDKTFELLTEHAMGFDVPLKKVMLGLKEPRLKTDTLLSNADDDVWSINIDALWVDWIYGDNCFTENHLTMHACERIFLEPTSVSMWLAALNTKDETEANRLEFVANIGDKSPQIMINHYQLQTILNIVEEALEAIDYFDKLFTFLAPTDANGKVIKSEVDLVGSVNVPGVDVFLLLEPFAQYNLNSSIKIDIESLIEANSCPADTDSGKSVETEAELEYGVKSSSPKNNLAVDVASEVLVESTADLIFPVDAESTTRDDSVQFEDPLQKQLDNSLNMTNPDNPPAQNKSPQPSTSTISRVSKPAHLDPLSDILSNNSLSIPQVPCNSVISQNLYKPQTKTRATQTKKDKANDLLEFTRRRGRSSSGTLAERVSNLHVAAISVRQSIEVFLHNTRHITVHVKHIEIDDMGTQKLMEIGQILTRYAQRRPVPPTVTARSDRKRSVNICERDSEVVIDIYPDSAQIQIEASNLNIRLSTSMLGNIGPFAEFDVIQKKQTDCDDTDENANEIGGDVPEITVKAKLVNFTIEPDSLPLHREMQSLGTPFQICIPHRGIEVSFKIADGRLEILRLLQEEIMSRYGDSVSQQSVSTVDDFELNRLQETEHKLVGQLNGARKQIDQLNQEKESYRNQVQILDEQLKRSNQDRSALEEAYQTLLNEYLKTQNK